MNRLFTVLSLAFLGLIVANCNKDDGNSTGTVVPLRDRTEVRKENTDQINHYLDNNYMIIDGDNITFDSLTGNKSTGPKVALRKDPRINIKIEKVTSDNYEYEAIRLSNGTTTLKFTKPKDTLSYDVAFFFIPDGSGIEQTGKNESISTIDSVYVKTKTFSLKNELAATNGDGSYFSFPITLKEYRYMSQGAYHLIPLQLRTAERQLLTKLKTATGIKLASNGTSTYDKGSAGRVIAIVPSGVGYFNAGYGGKVKAYEPHIIDMTLVAKRERDHDGDGILSKYEVEKIMNLGREATDADFAGLTIHDYFTYDTDGDGIPNFLDDDDDGDGILTKTELLYKDKNDKNAYYKYYDTNLKNCSDIYRYLDRTCFPDTGKDGFPDWSTAKKNN